MKKEKIIKAWAITTEGELNWFKGQPEIYSTREKARKPN